MGRKREKGVRRGLRMWEWKWNIVGGGIRIFWEGGIDIVESVTKRKRWVRCMLYMR